MISARGVRRDVKKEKRGTAIRKHIKAPDFPILEYEKDFTAKRRKKGITSGESKKGYKKKEDNSRRRGKGFKKRGKREARRTLTRGKRRGDERTSRKGTKGI